MRYTSLELHTAIREIRKPNEQIYQPPDTWLVEIELLYESIWMTNELIDDISLAHFMRTKL